MYCRYIIMSRIEFTEGELKVLLNIIKEQVGQHGAGCVIDQQKLGKLQYNEHKVITKLHSKYGNDYMNQLNIIKDKYCDFEGGAGKLAGAVGKIGSFFKRTASNPALQEAALAGVQAYAQQPPAPSPYKGLPPKAGWQRTVQRSPSPPPRKGWQRGSPRSPSPPPRQGPMPPPRQSPIPPPRQGQPSQQGAPRRGLSGIFSRLPQQFKQQAQETFGNIRQDLGQQAQQFGQQFAQQAVGEFQRGVQGLATSGTQRLLGNCKQLRQELQKCKTDLEQLKNQPSAPPQQQVQEFMEQPQQGPRVQEPRVQEPPAPQVQQAPVAPVQGPVEQQASVEQAPNLAAIDEQVNRLQQKVNNLQEQVNILKSTQKGGGRTDTETLMSKNKIIMENTLYTVDEFSSDF